MKLIFTILLLIPIFSFSQTITDHNLEWTLNNNPFYAKTTYELKVRFDYVMDKKKMDTVTKLIFDIKEVNATVESKVNTESLNGNGLIFYIGYLSIMQDIGLE